MYLLQELPRCRGRAADHHEPRPGDVEAHGGGVSGHQALGPPGGGGEVGEVKGSDGMWRERI